MCVNYSHSHLELNSKNKKNKNLLLEYSATFRTLFTTQYQSQTVPGSYHLISWELVTAIILIVLVQCISSSPVSIPSSATPAAPAPAPYISAIHDRVPTGAVIHIFPRYGYLSLSMRVVPKNDSQSWVFLEPVRSIFVPSTLVVEEKRYVSPTAGVALPLHNEFHIDLCENVGQLVKAYFKRFVIEGLDKPWQAFSGGWRTPSLSKYFGIDPNFVVGDYRYMLIRVMMARNTGKMQPLMNITVNPEVKLSVDRFAKLADPVAMHNFSTTVGTHYVKSYITGNAIYQVFVYDPAGFEAVKRRLSEFTPQKGNLVLSQLPSLLPLWGNQIGKLFVLNAAPDVALKVQQLLTLETFKDVVVPNIFKLHNNVELVRQVEGLLSKEPNGLLGIELKTIDIIFTKIEEKKRFVDSLKHLLQLWELNFS